MTQTPPVTVETLAATIQAVREGRPLTQHLTNEVTMNDVANLTLHWGGLPVMADSPGDAGQMAELARAVLLNAGQVPDWKVDAMHEAGETATTREIPLIYDPVGVGTTQARNETAQSLLDNLECSVIKGNYGEISALAGVEATVKGVESVGEYDDIVQTAQALAASTDAVVVASGVEDIVADGDRAYRITGGHEAMGTVVGTGCLLGATIATFSGALETQTPSSLTETALHATLAFAIAGERAATLETDGPASYRIAFLDSVAAFTADAAHSLETADGWDGLTVDLESRIERLE